MNNFKKTFLIPATIMATYVGSANADNDRGDLDDIKLYDIVKLNNALMRHLTQLRDTRES